MQSWKTWNDYGEHLVSRPRGFMASSCVVIWHCHRLTLNIHQVPTIYLETSVWYDHWPCHHVFLCIDLVALKKAASFVIQTLFNRGTYSTMWCGMLQYARQNVHPKHSCHMNFVEVARHHIFWRPTHLLKCSFCMTTIAFNVVCATEFAKFWLVQSGAGSF